MAQQYEESVKAHFISLFSLGLSSSKRASFYIGITIFNMLIKFFCNLCAKPDLNFVRMFIVSSIILLGVNILHL